MDYEQLPSSGDDGGYSSLVGEVVERCLTYDKNTRPDSVQVSGSTARSQSVSCERLIGFKQNSRTCHRLLVYAYS